MSESKHTMLSKDARPITSISIGDDYQRSHAVGRYGVTKIVAVDDVDETSETRLGTWFEVWKGDALFARVSADYIGEIFYQEGQTL